MKSYEIVDNFLDKNSFLKIKDRLTHEEFSWYYRPNAVEPGDHCYFTHCFFNNDQIFSNDFNLIKPVLNKLNYSSLIQVRANLVLKTKVPEKSSWHVDYYYKNFKTAILYINESNGPTMIKEKKNVKVFPKENKILIMSGDVEHAATTQTDTKRRIILNINYYEK